MRFFRAALATALASVIAIFAFGGTAHADEVDSWECPTWLVTSTMRGCVYYGDGGDVVVYIVMNSDKSKVYGWVYSYYYFVTGTVYVQQCDGYGHNCTTIAANSETGILKEVKTLTKSTAAGHAYRACASIETGDPSITNRCSPFFPVS